MNSRLKKIYFSLENTHHLEGLLVTSPANISYLTEFQSRESYLLARRKNNFYFTDSRYLREAKLGLKNRAIVKKINSSFYKVIAAVCKELKLERIGFEARYLPFAEYKKIKEALGRKIKLIPTHSLIEELRQIKSSPELSKIKKAVQITAQALEFIKGYIKPGKREIEIAAELERFIRYNGAGASSFEIIVASGANSSLPHYKTSQKRIRSNELVLIDMGVDYLGYKSDLTRVFFLGKMNFLMGKIYDIVLQAQSKALKLIKAGVLINKIDAASRRYITDRGYGSQFLHNLGHGIGLEVHEAPYISWREHSQLEQGMVFTLEPAVYLPGKFGIRLEDMVVVKKDGCEVLSGALHK